MYVVISMNCASYLSTDYIIAQTHPSLIYDPLYVNFIGNYLYAYYWFTLPENSGCYPVTYKSCHVLSEMFCQVALLPKTCYLTILH